MTLRPGLLALADDRILNPAWFEGLSDTLRTLADAVGGAPPASLLRLQRDLETAYDSRPATIAAAREWLDRLDASVADVAAQIAGAAGPDADGAAAPATEATFWADALVRQCRTVQDELALLAPWSALPAGADGFGDLPGIREIPTLRELAALDVELLPAIERRRRADTSPADRAWLDELGRAATEASRRAAERIAEIERLALQCDELARMEYDFLYDKASHLLAIGYNVGERRRDPSYLRSARLGSAVRRASWRSRRDSCRRRTGSRSGACSRPQGGNRCSCRGAARCSST